MIEGNNGGPVSRRYKIERAKLGRAVGFSYSDRKFSSEEEKKTLPTMTSETRQRPMGLGPIDVPGLWTLR